MTPFRARTRYARHRALALFFVAALGVGGCKVRFIDSFSRESEEGLLRTYGAVERLFDAMDQAVRQSTPRNYQVFAAQYAEIHEMIQVLKLREDARPLNAESQGIVKIIDSLFTKYREDHRATKTFNEVLLGRHRDNLKRLFTAALKAERAKKEPDEP